MLEAIKNRRSVRFYRDEPVSDELIEEVLKAGFCAPSSHASTPWHVVVVKDQQVKDELAGIHRWSRILARVPIVLVVCTDRRGFDHFWVEDGSAFMENILIQASELGLGTCWIGIQGLTDENGRNAEEIVRRACNLPDHMGVLGLTPIGYAARYPGPHEPKLLEGRVHYDRYEE